MGELNTMQQVAAWVLPVLFAITVHETAHGWMALRFGDPTAKMLGRLTLNPVKHIDPVGTILVPGMLLLMPGNFLFGWAKPVPITYENLRSPKRDMALVALAGPMANLVMGLFWALVLRLGALWWPESPGPFLVYAGVAGVFVNTILMVLNLLPLPPLDGGRVLTGLLPGRLSWQFSRIEPYGIFILLGLLVTGILGMILWPVVVVVLALFTSVSGVALSQFMAVLQLLMS